MYELQMMKNSMSLILLLNIIPKNFNKIFWMQRDMKYSFMPHVNAKLSRRHFDSNISLCKNDMRIFYVSILLMYLLPTMICKIVLQNRFSSIQYITI